MVKVMVFIIMLHGCSQHSNSNTPAP